MRAYADSLDISTHMHRTTHPAKPNALGVIPPEPVQAAVRALIQSAGEREAGEKLTLDRTTLARVAAGLGVRKGTLALVRERLRALSIDHDPHTA
jgi:hypothetical protein